MDRSSHGLI